MSRQILVRRSPISIHETSLGSLEQADAEEVGEPACTAGTSSDATSDLTIEQIRAVKGTLNFLSALIAFYGDLAERDAHHSARNEDNESASLQ
jgi:hypothetical protein